MKESMKDDLFLDLPNQTTAVGESLTRFLQRPVEQDFYISSLLISESFLCATRTRIKISTYHHGIYHGVYPCYSIHPLSGIVSDVI